MIKLLFMILILNALAVHAAERDVVLGVVQSATASGTRGIQSGKIVKGLRFFEQWQETQEPIQIGDDTYRIKLDIREDGGDIATMLETMESMTVDPEIDFLLGPMQSDFTCAANSVVQGRKLLLATSAGADACVTGRDRVFSQLTPASKTFRSSLLAFKLAGAKTFSYVMEEHPYTLSACGGTEDLAEELGMSVVGAITVPPSLGDFSEDDRLAWQRAAEQLSELGQDFVVMCAFPAAGFEIVRHSRNINFAPGNFLLTPLTPAWDTFELRHYLVGSAQWTPEARFPSGPYYGSVPDFVEGYQNMWDGETPGDFSAFGASAPLIYLHSIAAAQSVDPDEVEFAMSRIDLSYFYGRLLFDANNGALIDTVTSQYQLAPDSDALADGEAEAAVVVAPPRAQVATLIYPMPSWDERETAYGWFETTDDIVIAVLLGVAIAIVLGWFVFIVVYRNNAVINASQPMFCAFILLGSITMLAAMFAWLSYVTDASCQAFPWIFGTGFIITFGSLAAKTWRIVKLFLNKQLRKVVVTRTHILIIIGLLLAGLYAILLPWAIVSPMKSEVRQPDEYNRSEDYVICAVDSTGRGFAIAAVVYCFALILVAMYFSFRVRNVRFVLFNESKAIAFAIYNIFVFGVLVVALVAANIGGDDSSTTLAWVRSMCVILGTLITVFVLFVPKALFIRKGVEQFHGSDTDTHRSTSLVSNLSSDQQGTGASFNSSESTGLSPLASSAQGARATALEQENARLRARLLELENNDV
jgi:ABC-type branched-subunit amino acid transport system substrate-binding protein